MFHIFIVTQSGLDGQAVIGYDNTMNEFGSLHYNAIGPWLKRRFGERVVKLSLDGGFTCPNRDGSCGVGGCVFCADDGSGAFTGSIPQQMALLDRKWPDTTKFLAYFQNHTNTYAEPERLRVLWDEALAHPGVVGLAVATRPDCLPPNILDLLAEYNEKTFLWIELGLQTANETTALFINRCYPNETYEKAVRNLTDAHIRYVTHLILGLPGESREDMLSSSAFVSAFHPFGIKLHMLHVMKDTALARLYPGGFSLMDKEAYIDIVVDILERLPGDTTVHRLTGDAPRAALIAPLWTSDKHAVLNGIQQRFKARGTYQGIKMV